MNDPVERDDVIDAICNKCMFEHKMERRMPTLCRNCKTVKMIQAILSADKPVKKWIKHSGDEWVVRVECPNCHRRFQFSPRLMWKCCPLCETKMNGMVKRKRIDDDNN